MPSAQTSLYHHGLVRERKLSATSGRAQDRILRRLNRKERKERRDSGQKGRGLALAAGRVLRPGQLAHLELIGAEIDEQTVFETGGLQVTKNLSHLLVGQSFGSF